MPLAPAARRASGRSDFHQRVAVGQYVEHIRDLRGADVELELSDLAEHEEKFGFLVEGFSSRKGVYDGVGVEEKPLGRYCSHPARLGSAGFFNVPRLPKLSGQFPEGHRWKQGCESFPIRLACCR